MIFFGHLGIGKKLVSPWSKGLPVRWLLLGTVFPDLLDKTVYYALSFLTGKHGADLGLICGTRTFGHTALLLLVLVSAAWGFRSHIVAALALGICSHLVLDSFSEYFEVGSNTEVLRAIFWPLLGWRFPVLPYGSLREHAGALQRPFLMWTEGVGLAILGWDAWKKRIRHY